MENIKVREVKAEDAAELLAIYAYYVEDTAISFEYEVPSLEEFAARIDRISSRYPYLVAEAEGKLIGYAYADTFKGRPAYDWSVETTIYLDQDKRRQGAGRALYSELERRLKKMGILNMNACIASPTEASTYVGIDSINFHSRMGFSTVGTFHNSGSKFGKWFDMVWMEKLIGNHEEEPAEVDFGKY